MEIGVNGEKIPDNELHLLVGNLTGYMRAIGAAEDAVNELQAVVGGAIDLTP